MSETDSERPRRRRASSVETGGAVAPGVSDKPRCFVVAPIGREGSDTRKRSDQILRHIIEPVVTALGYDKPLRADRISESGRITRQVIQHIVDDELVIADLTDSNPNVYYELALRHALRKPFVQLLAGDDPLPFDVSDQRTISVDHRDLDSVAAAREELRRQVEALAANPEVDTPLSFALNIASLKGSGDPGDRTQGEILEMLQELRAVARGTYTAVRRPPSGGTLEDIDALRRYVEVTSAHGDVVGDDVEALITPETSRAHDRWVDLVRANANSWLQQSRDDGPTSSDEPPF